VLRPIYLHFRFPLTELGEPVTMPRSIQEAAWKLRGLALGLSLGVCALSGCADDGYGGKDLSQEFEKPKDMPTQSIREADEDESPREKAAKRD
jgi:hypothetical protein